jgi:hypothetical protein
LVAAGIFDEIAATGAPASAQARMLLDGEGMGEEIRVLIQSRDLATIGIFDTDTNTLDLDLTFSRLMSPTTAAHFHAPAAPGVNAPTAVGFAGFPVGLTSGAYSITHVLPDSQ